MAQRAGVAGVRSGVVVYGTRYGGTLFFELPVIEGVCVYGGGMCHWFDWLWIGVTVYSKILLKVLLFNSW